MYVKGKLFTYVALYLAVFFIGFQWFFEFVKATNGYELPLLMLLLMNELAMFICLFGTWAGVEHYLKQGRSPTVLISTIICFICAGLFLYLGVQYWPEGVEIF